MIVSKDEDFLYLSGNDVNDPAFVWIRLGNCRNVDLFAALDDVLSELVRVIDSGAKVVEIQ